MARILAISSQTVFGPVGNSAAAPALEWLGHTVHGLPTVVLSFHPGHGAPAGWRIAGRDLCAMLGALEELGVLAACQAIMTGYFAADEQVHAVERIIQRLKQGAPAPLYLCDPVIGDDPGGLYVASAVAEAVRQRLVPLADIVAPNRFELEWLSGHAVTSPVSAIAAARALGRGESLLTSIPAGEGKIATLVVTVGEAHDIVTAILPGVPHGTGDLLSGLYLGNRLHGAPPKPALQKSLTVLDRVIAASVGTPTLDLATGLRAS